MTQAASRFIEQHRAASLAGSGRDWLDEARSRALEALSRDGLPGPRDELWKYTPVRPIERRPFELARAAPGRLDERRLDEQGFPGLDCRREVFENGRRVAGLCRGELGESVTCVPLGEAFDHHAEAIAPFFREDFEGSAQGFAAMNAAFADDGLFVDVPDGVEAEAPLLLLHAASDTGTPLVSHPRVIIRLGEGASLVFIESFSGEAGHRNLGNVVTQIHAGAGSRVRHLRVQADSDKGMLVNRLDVNLEAGADYTGFGFDFGGRLVRHDLNVSLNAADASCTLNGLYVLDGRQHVDNHTRVDHRVPNTHSAEFYKGVLDGHSRGVFNGKVVVHRGADGTRADQTNANLLLSRNAEADSKPELEIYADDVQCSHGATIGQLDEDALFYLRSRGMDADEARGLLTYAFCREVIDRLEIDAVRERLTSDLLGYLPAGLVVRDSL